MGIALTIIAGNRPSKLTDSPTDVSQQRIDLPNWRPNHPPQAIAVRPSC